MEIKWICIAVAVVFGMIGFSCAVEEYSKKEIGVAAVQNGLVQNFRGNWVTPELVKER